MGRGRAKREPRAEKAGDSAAIYGPNEGEFNFCCRPNKSFGSEVGI